MTGGLRLCTVRIYSHITFATFLIKLSSYQTPVLNVFASVCLVCFVSEASLV